MTDKPNSSAINSDEDLLNGQLAKSLSEGLSDAEKNLRDREVVEQAQKYFGGLNARERVLLGIGSAVEAESVGADPRVGGVVRSEPGTEWTWAVLCGLVFSGVLVWVIRGQ